MYDSLSAGRKGRYVTLAGQDGVEKRALQAGGTFLPNELERRCASLRSGVRMRK